MTASVTPQSDEKKCTKCGGPGPFGRQKNAKDGLHSWCRACGNAAAKAYRLANPEKYKASLRKYAEAHLAERRVRQKKRYKENPTKGRQHAKDYRLCHPEKYKAAARTKHQRTLELGMWKRAKKRAAEKGWAFNLEPTDIVIPERCPLLGMLLKRNATTASKRSAPSLDRIQPQLGYTRGNVWVISLRANTMKSDATLEELELLTSNLRAAMNKP